MPLKRSITWLEETLSADWSRDKRCGRRHSSSIHGGGYGGHHGPFLNPEEIDRFILPLHQGNGGETERDGNVCHVTYRGDLADPGIHAFQAIAPVAGIDIKKVKRRWGADLFVRKCRCRSSDNRSGGRDIRIHLWYSAGIQIGRWPGSERLQSHGIGGFHEEELPWDDTRWRDYGQYD